MNEHNQSKMITNLYGSLLVVLPLINQYLIGGVSFEIIFALFGILVIIMYNGQFRDATKIRMGLLFYCGYVIFFLFLQGIRFDANNALRMVFRCGLFVLVTFETVVVMPSILDLKHIMKVYTKVVMILSVIVIIQYAIYLLFGKTTVLLIPGLELRYSSLSSAEYSATVLSNYLVGWHYRPSALFLEPAHYAQYVLPWLFISILDDDTDNVKPYQKIIGTLGVVLSASSLGILGVGIIWSWYLLRLLKAFNRKAFMRAMIVLGVIVVGAVIASRIKSVSFYFMMKVDELLNKVDQSNSFTMRILRGIACFKQFDIFEQLFGCGYGNLEPYIKVMEIHTNYDAAIADITYMNGISSVLCQYGVLGTLLYSVIFFIKQITSNIKQISLLVCLVVLMITSALFNTPVYYLSFVIFLLLSIEEKTMRFNEK